MAKWQIFLKVIPEPESDKRVIFRHDRAVSGKDRSAPDICCGNCGVALITGMAEINFLNIVFECFACGAFNNLI